MGLNFGSGVKRTLDAASRQFSTIVQLYQKPPLSPDITLMSQNDLEEVQKIVRSMMPSGFMLDPTRTMADYKFDSSWTNFFQFGNPTIPIGQLGVHGKVPTLWANVNGWIIPVCGTDVETEGDLYNSVKLYPAPESDTRVDLVFLEAWQARVDANPSTVNKPSASTIWKYGNVQYGGVNFDDDIMDPTLGIAASARVQAQYRLRVIGSGAGLGASVSLDVYPDGLGDPNVYGQGTGTTPVNGLIFSNMAQELGDPSLWRAGDGDPTNALGTVDGYTYAIPVCAVFRRNSGAYVAVNSAGNPNQNGAFERTPATKLLPDPLAGDRILLTAMLTLPLTATEGVSSDVVISLNNLNGSGLEDFGSAPSNFYMTIEDEIIQVGAINLVNGTISIPAGGRGAFGTAAVGHAADTALDFYNLRPDGRYADEIVTTDILDLRRGVNAQEWDYRRLLEHNVAALAKGNLHSAWKKAGAGDTQGPVVHEVCYLFADGSTAVPNHTEALDGPDGIRTIFSDAATIQPNVTMLLDNSATQDANQMVGFTNDPLDDTVQWDVAPGFYPSAFMNVYGFAAPDKDVWTNGSLIFLYTGGNDGTGGARGTFRDGTTRAVRPLMPLEFWKDNANLPASGLQAPVTMRFLDQRGFEAAPPSLPDVDAAKHIGPMYPTQQSRFTHPYIVLGSVLRQGMKLTGISATFTPNGWFYELDVGINFDAYPGYRSPNTYLQVDDTSKVQNLLLRDSRTLYGMLTNGGTDASGYNSEVYVCLYGDTASRGNNGVFRVVGAGQTTYYTTNHASNSTSIVLMRVNAVPTEVPSTTASTLTVEFRSHYSNADDGSSYSSKQADVVIGLTDLGGAGSDHPWTATALGFGETYDLSVTKDATVTTVPVIKSKLLLDMTLIYHPGRGGMARVPDNIVRFAMKGGTTETIGGYLRQSKISVDPTFPGQADETYWDLNHIQLWNRLGGLGLYAPFAPGYGGNVVGYTEQDREHEVFYDKGSKTLLLRPFRDRQMTLKAMTFPSPPMTNCLLGDYTYPDTAPKDALSVWTAGKRMGFPVPYEFMPRFGRQDIPCWQRVGVDDPFLPGINHLFMDAADVTYPVLNIIGGRDNITGGNQVTSFFFVTSTPNLYGKSTTIVGPTNTVPAVGARRTVDIDGSLSADAAAVFASLAKVNSSDFGKGLKGIQLPPYHGIARLYGVYDVRDYATKGRTFKANRYEIETDPAPNLLREDAVNQTLFILQDGARDLTTETGDHTYIIPSNVIDVTRALQYVDGDTFEDYQFIVECSVFGFSRGWINENNYVLTRLHSGQGVENIDGTPPVQPDGELAGVHMVIPCPAGNNDQFYVAYNRSVYQGDPYMSRSGDSKTSSDYETRYGQISMANQYLLETPIQQFDSNGAFVPEMPNPKTFEILASMDFYTTLGTGKIGGQLSPGTVLDIGHTEYAADTRMPESSTQPAWRVVPRTFTDPQSDLAPKASSKLWVKNVSRLCYLDGTSPDVYAYHQLHIGLPDSTNVTLYASTIDGQEQLLSAGVDSEDIWIVRNYGKDQTHPLVASVSVNLPPGGCQVEEISVSPPVFSTIAGVIVKPRVQLENFSVYGYLTSKTNLRLVMTNTWGIPFDFLGTDGQVVTFTFVGSQTIAAGAEDVLYAAATLNGAAMSDMVLIQDLSPGQDKLIFTANITSVNRICIYAYNPTGASITLTNRSFKLAVLSDILASDHTITGAVTFDATLFDSVGDPNGSAENFAHCVNGNSKLNGKVWAWSSEENSEVSLNTYYNGGIGNEIQLRLGHTRSISSYPTVDDMTALSIVMSPAIARIGAVVDVSYPVQDTFHGGLDIPANAGSGTTQLELTGMTERFPMGVLLQDSDFLCEDPLRDTVSAMKSSPSGPRPIQTNVPLTNGGDEYTRFWGESGEVISLSDGSISVLSYGAWTEATPTGTKMFRLYRGGGPLFLLSGETPGGPLDWVSDTFPPALQPVLKGGILACRAMLVRNFHEEVNSGNGPYKVSDGDEIQMVIATYGLIGHGTEMADGYSMDGIIGPAGYGEGYAAADRFRLAGKPMFRGFGEGALDPTTVPVAVYFDEQR